MKPVNPTTVASRRYKIHLSIGLAAYVVTICTVVWTLNHVDLHGILLYLVSLAPSLPVAYLIGAIERYFRDSDELERRILTEALAYGAAGTAIISLTYGFLENAGLPHLSAWWTFATVMALTAIRRISLNNRYQ